MQVQQLGADAYATAWDQDRLMEMVDLAAYADDWPGGF